MRAIYFSVFAWILICALASADAFLIPAHVASANRVLDELSTYITPGPTNDTIVFLVKGKRFELSVSVKEAYQVILDNQDFFRAGVIGPNGFPDVVTGQYWQHTNQNLQAQRLTQAATGGRVDPIDHSTTDPWELRQGPSEFRSVDFAMGMLEHLQDGPFTGDERSQAFAFILGYFSHCIGDSFAHTWVNELSGGAWDLGEGTGIFGSVTEEVKHIAIEKLVDHHLPGFLLNHDGSTGGELDRLTVRAPIFFLDSFFSSMTPHALDTFGNKDSSNPVEYLNYWRNIDRFYGSAVYNYLNLQVDAARAIQQFSQLKPFMDWAARYQPDNFVNILLDIADMPEQIKAQFKNWFAGDIVPFVTGGFLHCQLFNGGTTGLEALRKVWDYLGGFNARIKHYEERGRVMRINWLRLSECTAQNLARTNGADFDPAFPDKNRDACTVLADTPWADEGDGTGLFRGSLREGVSEEDDEFLRTLRLYFRGADEGGQGFEVNNWHRYFHRNLLRLKSYLLGFAFILDDLEDAIIPDRLTSDFNRICALARDPAEERCLNLRLFSIAFPVEEASCLKQFASCTARALSQCAKGLCRSTCTIPVVCEGLCDANRDVCRQLARSQCDLVPFACVGIPFGPCFHTSIYDDCVDASDEACEFLSGGSPQCVSSVLQCGTREATCSVSKLELLFLQKGWASYLLHPVRQVCNIVDGARDFFHRFDTPEERIDEAERYGFPVREFNELIGIFSVIVDKLSDIPPEYFVNIAFLYEDLRKNAAYLTDYLAAIERQIGVVRSLPDGKEKQILEGAIAKLRRIGTAVAAGDPTELLTFDFSSDLNELTDTAQRELDEFGALLLMFLGQVTGSGPTTKQVLADIGPDFVHTFKPFFNTVQGMKLVGLRNHGDVERLFSDNGIPQDRLPWVLGDGFFSEQCVTGDSINLFCDVFMSLDDPNCFGPTGKGCRPEDRVADPARFNWVAGRGMVAWNEHGLPSYVLTNMPLASSPLAYRGLYTRIFDVPQLPPSFLGFEDPLRKWTLPPGFESNLGSNLERKTEGDVSLQLNGNGWLSLRSPTFDTAEFEVVGDQLSVDVFIPEGELKCGHGGMRMTVHVPAAGIYEQKLGWQPFKSLPRGNWSTLQFPVADKVRTALLGDFPNAHLTLSLDLSSCHGPILVDNVRFTGHLFSKTIFHPLGSDSIRVATNAFLSFEDAADWKSPQTTVRSEMTLKSHLNASLAVPIHGWTEVRSRKFSSTAINDVTITSKLNLDILVPKPQSHEDWIGFVRVSISCPDQGIVRQSLGSRPLIHLFQGEFDALQFDLPDKVVNVLRGTFSNCTISLIVNCKDGAGIILFDKLGFVIE